MIEIPYSKIGEAIGVSRARQAELLGNLLLFATRSEAMAAIDTPSAPLAEESDPVEETILILKWIAGEPSLTVEERIFLAHRTGIMLSLRPDEEYEDDAFILDEEDQEMREILRAYLLSEEGRDMFGPIINDLEGDESGEDEREGF